VGSGGCAQEVATGLPEVVAVHEDVLEGVAATTVGTGGVIASGGTKVVRVVHMEGVPHDELETR